MVARATLLSSFPTTDQLPFLEPSLQPSLFPLFLLFKVQHTMSAPTIQDYDNNDEKIMSKKENPSSPASLDLDYKLKEIDQATDVDVESVEKRKQSNIYAVIVSGVALVR